MRFELDKWYLDITGAGHVGYYYFARLRLGPLQIGHVAQHTFLGEKQHRGSRWHLRAGGSMSDIAWGTSRARIGEDCATMALDHGRFKARGTWQYRAAGSVPLGVPLYADRCGTCDWRIGSPRADVELCIEDSGVRQELLGTGYVDRVRLTIPFWRLSFRRLLWGRLHHAQRWQVLFFLESDQGQQGYFADPDGQTEAVQVETSYDPQGRLAAFTWTIGSSEDHPRPQPRVHARVQHCLDRRGLLEQDRLPAVVPSPCRRWLSRAGVEEKVLVSADCGAEKWTGIMEEVRWDA